MVDKRLNSEIQTFLDLVILDFVRKSALYNTPTTESLLPVSSAHFGSV